MRAGHCGDGTGSRHPRGRMVVPALCAAVLCVALAADAPVKIQLLSLTATSVPMQTITEQVPPSESGTPVVEDVVTLPVGQQYVWPSGIGLVVAPPTATAPSAPGGVAVVRVRTTVLNGSATPYDVDAVLGPSARFGGHDVAPSADSRFAAGTVEQVVPPGQRLAYETTFPAEPGALTLHYRADFRYEAVEFEGSAITFPHS